MIKPTCPECKSKLGEPEEGWFENIAVEHYHCPNCLRHWQRADVEKNRIREWAEAWIEYWTSFSDFARFLSGEHPYSDKSDKETIARYQTVLDALDGKLEMPPPKTWLKWP